MAFLLVEDDRALSHGLVTSLAQTGYQTHAVFDARSAVAACAQAEFELVILDLGLPDLDGVELVRQLRRSGLAAPVLILTARLDLDDRVSGLDAGADDYLSKPFDLPELEARIRALLRRSATPDLYHFGDIAFEPATKRTTVHGIEISLTAVETKVLELLLRRPGRVVSKSQFLDKIYDHADDTNPSMIEVFISRLRKKLVEGRSQATIRALRGLGYRLEQNGEK